MGQRGTCRERLRWPGFARAGWPLTLLAAVVTLAAGSLAATAVLAGKAPVPVARAAAAHGAQSSLVCSRDDREPGSDRGPVKGEPVRRSADITLVPAGAIDLTICDYNGMNATAATPQWGLEGIGVSDRRAIVGRLARELDAIRPTAPGVSYHCPSDDASQAVLYFGYRSGPGDVVTVGMRGCNAITNAAQSTISYPKGGPPARLGLGRPVIGQIARLAKPVRLRWARVSGQVDPGTPGQTAIAVNASHLWVAMAQVRHHRFSFRIAAPGRCTIELRGTAGHPNRLLARLRTTVAIGRTTRVAFVHGGAGS
ncbi:MAG: hypothetical protein ACRDKL_02845 [Solirubrobacteraceae bacterium]